MASAVDWSVMDPELVDLIIKRLDLVAFIRVGAVCRSWRSTMKTSTYISPPNSHSPWLILSSPNQPEHRYVHNPVDPKSLYKFNLPNIKHHVVIGSSHGFIISIDEIAQIHATNPVTGSHKLLPAITSLLCCEGAVRDPATYRISSYLIRDAPSPYSPIDFPIHNVRDPAPEQQIEFLPEPYSPIAVRDPAPEQQVEFLPIAFPMAIHNVRRFFYTKVAIFPISSVGLISVIMHNHTDELAFACETDESWTSIESPFVKFQDVLFYKGLLYAVNVNGCLVAFDILNFSSPSVPVIYVKGCLGWMEMFARRYLVQSPCASDLFLIVRKFNSPVQTAGFKIYKLNQDIYQWSEVNRFGNEHVVVFLGCNQSVMLLAKDIPSIALNKGDYIYFTDDSKLPPSSKQKNS